MDTHFTLQLLLHPANVWQFKEAARGEGITFVDCKGFDAEAIWAVKNPESCEPCNCRTSLVVPHYACSKGFFQVSS